MSFSDCEFAWTSFNKANRIYKERSSYDGKIHPTQKPIQLYKWILTNYAKSGDKILDTHLGSGSSAIAAHQLDFDFVGCEIDPKYFAATEKRFKENTIQTDLFKQTA